jgi:hypothetical protein
MFEDSTHAEYRYFSKFKMRLYQPEVRYLYEEELEDTTEVI